MIDLLTVSSRLKELRKDMGLSAEEFASRAHVPATAYKNWERAELCPMFMALKRIAKEYDVDVDYLIGKRDTYGFYVSGHKLG